MKRYALVLPALLLVGGCSFLTGLSGSSDRLSCPLSEGVTCKPMSQVYEESVQGGQRDKAEAPTSETQAPTPKRADSRSPARLVTTATADGEPLPLRTRPNTQRIWIAPWQDADGDLHEDAWIVVRLDDGDWMLDHVRDRVRSGFSATLKAPPAASTAEPREEESPAAATAIPSLIPAPGPVRGPAGGGQPFVPTR